MAKFLLETTQRDVQTIEVHTMQGAQKEKSIPIKPKSAAVHKSAIIERREAKNFEE